MCGRRAEGTQAPNLHNGKCGIMYWVPRYIKVCTLIEWVLGTYIHKYCTMCLHEIIDKGGHGMPCHGMVPTRLLSRLPPNPPSNPSIVSPLRRHLILLLLLLILEEHIEVSTTAGLLFTLACPHARYHTLTCFLRPSSLCIYFSSLSSLLTLPYQPATRPSSLIGQARLQSIATSRQHSGALQGICLPYSACINPKSSARNRHPFAALRSFPAAVPNRCWPVCISISIQSAWSTSVPAHIYLLRTLRP